MKEKLHCEAGHDWKRTPTCGRKPRYCPHHKAGDVVELETPTPVPEVSEVKPQPKIKKPDSLIDEVEAVLTNDRVNNELKRKLLYCQTEIDRGRDDALITGRRRELLRESKRG